MQKQMEWDRPFEYHFERGLYYHEVHPGLICGTQLRNAEEVNVLRMVEEVDTIINVSLGVFAIVWHSMAATTICDNGANTEHVLYHSNKRAFQWSGAHNI